MSGQLPGLLKLDAIVVLDVHKLNRPQQASEAVQLWPKLVGEKGGLDRRKTTSGVALSSIRGGLGRRPAAAPHIERRRERGDSRQLASWRPARRPDAQASKTLLASTMRGELLAASSGCSKGGSAAASNG
jgi:hypothetical protein